MEFRETLLAAQRNQQQKSSQSSYYKARFDPPKKEQRQKDKLSANIQKFLAKKDEEEKQKKLEAQRKREELLALRDPKALRKIQKTLKVIKSANKSVLADAVDRDNTAVTREGPEQPDQDDYGYESQEAAALYEKMMQKYSKMPDEPKFPTSTKSVKKDLNGTIERVKHALQHEDDPVPHKRRRKTGDGAGKLPQGDFKPRERDLSPPPKYESEKKKDEKPEKPKFRKPAPPPMDFNQLLKLAEQKKSEPLEVASKKPKPEATPEPERLMTKKQKREYEEEMARRQRRLERLEAEKNPKKIQKDDRVEKEKKPEPAGFGRIPKIGDRANGRHDSPKASAREPDRDRDRERNDREKERMQRERERAREKEISDRDKAERERERIDKERLEKLKAERERIDREMERLNKDREKLDKTLTKKLESKPVDRSKLPVDRTKLNSKELKQNIDLKSQNTYRIDKKPIPKDRPMNGHSSQGKPVPKQLPVKDKAVFKKPDGSPKLNGQARPENGKRLPEKVPGKRPDDRRPVAQPAGPSKPKISTSFDFDKHVNSLKGGRQFPPGDVKRKPHPDDKKKLRQRERAREKEISDRDKAERERERIDKERLEKLKAERERIDREMERLNKDREKLDKTLTKKLESKPVDRSKLPVDRTKLNSKELKQNIDLKSQNTYRIDKKPIPKDRPMNGHSSQGKPVPKQLPVKDKAVFKKPDGSPKLNGQARPENGKRLPEKVPGKRPDDRRPVAQPAGPSKPKISTSFDFDKHVNSLKGGRQFPPGDVKRKPHPDDKKKLRRRLESEEDYDSEMDDFIDDGDEEMDYSTHIKEIFGYDKSRYRDMDDDDDPSMESSFVQQQREEYISKKHGIMEDLEDMRLEAMMKAKTKGKKKRRISDD